MTPVSSPISKPVLAFTRRALAFSALLAVIAGIQLYVFTGFTETWFAWTIAAPLSAAFLGAGYWTGAVLLLLAVRESAWANIRVALAAVGTFVPLMLLTTLLHLDRFHLQSTEFTAWLAAWAWLIVYLAIPVVVIAIVIRQRRAPGGDPPALAPVSAGLRVLIGVNAALALIVGLALFGFPQAVAPVWPWPLTPLTARAIGTGFITMSAGSLQFLIEKDWTRTRIGTVPYTLVGALQLLALARYPETVDWGRPASWLYALFMALVLIGGGYSAVVAWRPSSGQARRMP